DDPDCAGAEGCPDCFVDADCEVDPCQHETCQGGVCVAEPYDCADADPCTDDGCSGGTCWHTPVAEGAACDDGVFCTTGEVCTFGVCAGDPSGCGCEADEDCAAYEDGDPCNGTPSCVGGACVAPTPDATITCNDGDACTTDRCDAGVGCVAEVIESPLCGVDCEPILFDEDVAFCGSACGVMSLGEVGFNGEWPVVDAQGELLCVSNGDVWGDQPRKVTLYGFSDPEQPSVLYQEVVPGPGDVVVHQDVCYGVLGGELRWYDARDPEQVIVGTEPGEPASVALSVDDSWLVTLTEDGALRVHARDEDAPAPEFRHQSSVWTESGVFDLMVVGSHLYLIHAPVEVNAPYQLRTLHITPDTGELTEVGLAPFSGSEVASLSEVGAVSPHPLGIVRFARDEDLVWVTLGYKGLYLFQLAPPSVPTLLGSHVPVTQAPDGTEHPTRFGLLLEASGQHAVVERLVYEGSPEQVLFRATETGPEWVAKVHTSGAGEVSSITLWGSKLVQGWYWGSVEVLPSLACAEACDDGTDNDQDGFADCDDLDCLGVEGCVAPTHTTCQSALDCMAACDAASFESCAQACVDAAHPEVQSEAS
ncbi:MAG: hypothetical protein QF464_14160, partial [Myxococcota bacterium]|nr:hypothetical protein [Myxococcota bacterium]